MVGWVVVVVGEAQFLPHPPTRQPTMPFGCLRDVFQFLRECTQMEYIPIRSPVGIFDGRPKQSIFAISARLASPDLMRRGSTATSRVIVRLTSAVAVFNRVRCAPIVCARSRRGDQFAADSITRDNVGEMYQFAACRRCYDEALAVASFQIRREFWPLNAPIASTARIRVKRLNCEHIADQGRAALRHRAGYRIVRTAET